MTPLVVVLTLTDAHRELMNHVGIIDYYVME